ncbi:Uncharacterized protein dnm_034110 [Desulfonema magnum]|uniref:Uncharacterized protein n=1 Tax=Desulfonema magnum TaxID=45655 RepID=A0A975BLL8_9BACT|nr:Uncharacterized protein dnm_034110 [Desulfonema magnum]
MKFETRNSYICKYLSKSFLYIFFPTAEKPGVFLHGRRVVPGKNPGFFPGKY